MSNPEIDAFLREVSAFASKYPAVAPRIVDAASLGVAKALEEAYERAADMESACVALSVKRNSDWARDLLRQKIEKWKGKTSINWDWFLKEVKKP